MSIIVDKHFYSDLFEEKKVSSIKFGRLWKILRPS